MKSPVMFCHTRVSVLRREQPPPCAPVTMPRTMRLRERRNVRDEASAQNCVWDSTRLRWPTLKTLKSNAAGPLSIMVFDFRRAAIQIPDICGSSATSFRLCRPSTLSATRNMVENESGRVEVSLETSSMLKPFELRLRRCFPSKSSAARKEAVLAKQRAGYSGSSSSSGGEERWLGGHDEELREVAGTSRVAG